MTTELMTQPQTEEHQARFTKPLIDHGITLAEYNALRGDQSYKDLTTALGNLARRVQARRNPLGASLPLDTLDDLRSTPANTNLLFSTEDRFSEEERYELIKGCFQNALGAVRTFDLIETGPQNIPGWLHMLVVSPVDLAIHVGLDIFGTDSKQAENYCYLARALTMEIESLKKNDWIQGCLKKDGARLEMTTCQQWQKVSNPQKKGSPLIVRRMSVNPATWFGVEGTQYSVAPRFVRTLANRFPTGSTVLKAACGDLIVLTSILAGEPQILKQISQGTCPRIDVPGTELRYGQDWLDCPDVGLVDSEAWLVNSDAGSAYGLFGSLLCAVE